MKIRITLINGSTLDFDAPENFNFIGWAVSVRECGRWLMDKVYMPHESILYVMQIDEHGQPVMPKVEGTLQ